MQPGIRAVLNGLMCCVPWSPSHAQARDTVRLVRYWTSAQSVQSVADSLGEPSGLSVDSRGHIYISDIQAAKIWMLSPDGRLVGAVGRRGRGPGEFESPTGVAVAPDGALYVRDGQKVSRFVTSTRIGVPWRFERSFSVYAFADWRSTLPTRFSTDGRLFYPAFNRLNDSAAMGWYQSYTLIGEPRDSVKVPRSPNTPAATAWIQTNPSGGRMLRGLNHVPLAALPVWDVSHRGTLLFADGSDDFVRELDPGGRELRRLRVPIRSVPIPARERAESVSALRRRIDSIAVPRAQVKGIPKRVWDLEVPSTYAPIRAMFAGTDGSIWLQRWNVDHDRRTVFDVIQPNGRDVRTVAIPAAILTSPAPVLSATMVVAFQLDRETGAYEIASYRLPRPVNR
jgi:hypothetical protein